MERPTALCSTNPDYEGGHEITPYAVGISGGGAIDVLVYDNNWPAETRRLHINTRNNTWNYQLEPGDVYRGNAERRRSFLRRPRQV